MTARSLMGDSMTSSETVVMMAIAETVVTLTSSMRGGMIATSETEGSMATSKVGYPSLFLQEIQCLVLAWGTVSTTMLKESTMLFFHWRINCFCQDRWNNGNCTSCSTYLANWTKILKNVNYNPISIVFK